MCLAPQPFPQVDYGQGKQAWNPGKRDEVYRQIERARGDAGFAQAFAADILFGKSNSWYTYEVPRISRERDDPAWGTDNPQPQLVEKKSKYKNHLYNENTLNASKSWVSQAFGAPALKGKDGNWYEAKPLVKGGTQNIWNMKSFRGKESQADYGFLPGNRITDANTLRLLNEGHHAFTAKGYDGSEVYVPWAAGFVPGKAGRGRPEAGNSKREVARGAVERDMITPGTAKPGNVIGGSTADAAATLLSGAAAGLRDKTLLGGTK